MDKTSTNPLVLALAALDRLEPTDKQPTEAADWQEARRAILRAMQEREVFLTTVGAAVGLIDVLDDHNDALEAGDEDRVTELAEAGADAEDVLVDALNQVHDMLGLEDEASDDAELLEALDRFTSEEEDDLGER
jgi:hypothetical protein